MAKSLNDILKQAHDRIKGVHASATSAGSLGKDPGVDYDPKAGDEQDFVAKHSVQRWDEPYGNPNYSDKVQYSLDKPSEKRHGNDENEAKKAAFPKPVRESKEKEDAQCNRSGKGTSCPIHGLGECSMSRSIREEEQIDEVSSKLLKRAAHKAANKAMWDANGPKGTIYQKYAAKANKFRDAGIKKEKQEKDAAVKEDVEQIDEVSKATLKSYSAKASKQVTKNQPADPDKLRKRTNREKGLKMAFNKFHGYKTKVAATEEVEQVDEVLSKSAPAGEWIKDFQKSDNPKFAGKSKEKRKQMALAAYYSKQRNEETVQEDLAIPLLGGDMPPRGSSYGAADMVKAELRALADKAMDLVADMPAGMHIEPWCQAKIANAKQLVSMVHDYMVYGEHDKEENEQTGPETPMTFPNMSADVNTGRNV